MLLLLSTRLLGDGSLAVAFVNEINGDNDIYVRIFSPSLTVGRTDFINTGATQTVDPSITALTDGGYAVSYTVDDAQIAGRTVSISGFPGPQFGASGSTHSELATLSNGNFVVVHHGEAGTIDLEVLTPSAGLAGLASAGFGSDPDVAALRPLSYVRAPVYTGSLCQIAHPDRRHPDGLHPGGFRSAQRARDVLSEASYASNISAAHSS
jgi:hypothetical protein